MMDSDSTTGSSLTSSSDDTLITARPYTVAREPIAKTLAYGGINSGDSGRLFRLERGTPYLRVGKLVVATPQFRALTLYTPTTTNTQLPSATQTNVSVTYPTKAK